LAVIPWKNQVKAPTGYKHPNKQNLPPNISLEIDWIHGYCGDQNGLSYLEDDSVAYTAAAVGVCYRSEGHSQRFFSGHEGRITCITFAPDKRTVATGDGTVKSVVIIWDAITMK
jgi:microtubule-associated protein-like 6